MQMEEQLANCVPWLAKDRSHWDGSVREWLEQVAQRRALGQILNVVEVKARPWSMVLRVKFECATTYFKACSLGGRFEASLLVLLARSWPEQIPSLLETDDVRSWMLMADGGGPSASIKYQITGADGSESGTASLFEPQESINGGAAGDIGCDAGNCSAAGTNWQWSPPSATFASQSGTFYDVPFSLCSTGAFTSNNYVTQAISIKIGNNSYSVRSQTWSASSSSAGHGTLSNSLGDVSYSQ
jgi:hypothetical protein